MARNRKPVWKHKKDGTYQKCRHGGRSDDLSLSNGEMPPPPSIITENPARLREWNRLVKDPQYSPVLSPLFMGLVVEYVCLTADFMGDPHGMSIALCRHRLKLAGQLLLTPTAQANFPIPPPPRRGKNEFDDVDL